MQVAGSLDNGLHVRSYKNGVPSGNQPLRAGPVYNAHSLYSLGLKAILYSDCCPSSVLLSQFGIVVPVRCGVYRSRLFPSDLLACAEWTDKRRYLPRLLVRQQRPNRPSSMTEQLLRPLGELK
jgi:hypothetical protein